MTILRKLKITFPLTLILIHLAACSSTAKHEAGHEASHETLPQYVFSPTENAVDDVDRTLDKAKDANKLAMIVLGAQWCHDSRGLAHHFSSPDLQPILNDRFETIFVDVGFLEDRRDVTRKFDYPAHFATPTVLVVDPATNTLLNQDSLTTWQAAHSVPHETYLEYFSTIGKGEQPEQTTEATNASPYATQLEKFTLAQVKRLYAGYAALGPQLQSDVEGKEVNSEELNRMWVEVRDFRLALQKDIHRLRDTLKKSPNQALTLPVYAPLSWE